MLKFRAVCPGAFLLVLIACSSQTDADDVPPAAKTGGTSGAAKNTTGGARLAGSGGKVSESGEAEGLGGSSSGELGGATSSAGGDASSGVGTGGNEASGGNGTGGSNATGGDSAAGGNSTGGDSTTGTGGQQSGSSGGNSASVGGSNSGGISGSTGGMSSCVETSAETQATPPIIEFTIDNTQSMSDTAPSTNGQTKMQCTRTALAAAFPQLPTDYAVGMTYYHVRNGPCNDELQAVEIAPMTTNLTPLVNSINTQQQIQMTPSQDAWQFAHDHLLGFDPVSISSGILDYTQATRYVVVMTDGVPTLGGNCADSAGCGQGISVAQYQTYIDAVAAAYQQDGVQTFFIGVPGSENTDQVMCGNVPEYDPRSKLSELATAGGTAKAGCSNAGPKYCHIDLTDPNTDFVTELQNAVTSIAQAVASCTYPVPAPSDPDLVLDPDQVELRYYANGSTTYQQIARSDGCADSNGWQYTDATQSTVALCPGACSTVQADPTARIEVYFGCVSFQ